MTDPAVLVLDCVNTCLWWVWVFLELSAFQQHDEVPLLRGSSLQATRDGERDESPAWKKTHEVIGFGWLLGRRRRSWLSGTVTDESSRTSGCPSEFSCCVSTGGGWCFSGRAGADEDREDQHLQRNLATVQAKPHPVESRSVFYLRQALHDTRHSPHTCLHVLPVRPLDCLFFRTGSGGPQTLRSKSRGGCNQHRG